MRPILITGIEDPVREHDRHLQDRLHPVANLVGRRASERLSAVASLQQEGVAAGCPREPVAQHVDLTREDQRRHSRELGGRRGGLGRVGPRRLLLDGQGAPVIEARDDSGVGVHNSFEGVDHFLTSFMGGERGCSARECPDFPAYRAFAGRLSFTVVA